MRRAIIAWLLLGLWAGSAPGQTAPRVSSPQSIREIGVTPGAAIARTTLTAAEAGATIDFEVALRMRNFAELQQRVARHEHIERAEMAAKYHPLAGDYAAVLAWLKSQGLTVVAEDPNQLAVFARGTVAQLSAAFQASFARVTFRGQEYTAATSAPTLPAEIAPVVLGINGLQPHLRPQKHLRTAAMGKQSTSGNGPPFLPSQIALAYNGSNVNQTGAGQTIAIVIDTFPANSDLTSFWSQAGVAQSLSNIQEIQVVSGTLPAPSGEETLDVEWSSGLAPGATIRVYATVDLAFAHLDQAYAQLYADLPNQPALHQLSMSFGLGEIYCADSQMSTDEQYFASIASAGVTIFVSSGDGGSDPLSTGKVGGTKATVENPSNSPSVTAVGGTSLTVNSTTGAETSETVFAPSKAQSERKPKHM
jgi:kumamolisin